MIEECNSIVDIEIKSSTLLEKNDKSYSNTYYILFNVYMIIWRALVGECLQCTKDPTNKVGKNAFAVVRANSYCKGEVVGHVKQKSP